MGAKVKNKAFSFRWAAVTGAGCGLSWLALYTVLRLFGVQDPTDPLIVSTAAPIFFVVTISTIASVKQAATSEGPIWTWIMVYRKLALMLVAAVLVILIVLAAVAVDEAIIAGTTRLLAGVAVIVAIIGAVIGGLLANFAFARYRNSR